jgi:hypothetical protein
MPMRSKLWPLPKTRVITRKLFMPYSDLKSEPNKCRLARRLVAFARPAAATNRLSEKTCPHCKFGFQSSCEQREFMTGARAPPARVPLADGTLVATAELPPDDLIPSLWQLRTCSAPVSMTSRRRCRWARILRHHRRDRDFFLQPRNPGIPVSL